MTCKQSTPRKDLQPESKHTKVCSPRSTRCFPAQKLYRNQDWPYKNIYKVCGLKSNFFKERIAVCLGNGTLLRLLINHQHAGQIYATGFKAAGVGAQQTASAAAAYLLQDFESNWSHIDLCWIGDFFVFKYSLTVLDCCFSQCSAVWNPKIPTVFIQLHAWSGGNQISI